MNLASGKAELDSCPYVSEEARAQLSEASALAHSSVHDRQGGCARLAPVEKPCSTATKKTFYSPTLLAAQVGSDIAAADLEAKLKGWNAIQYERVGLNLRPELVAVKDASGDAAAFAAVAKQIAETSEFNVILITEDAAVMKAGVEACGFKRPLMYAATDANADDFGAIAKDNDLPLAIKADSADGLAALSEKLTGMGIKDLVLDPGSRDPKQSNEDMIGIRRAALKDGNRAMGFPTIAFPCEMASNIDVETMLAAMYIAKYGSIVVMSDFTGENIFPAAPGTAEHLHRPAAAHDRYRGHLSDQQPG